MSETKTTAEEFLGSGRFQVARRDIDDPHKKQDYIKVVTNDEDSYEDDNTQAKSLTDAIIEETENG